MSTASLDVQPSTTTWTKLADGVEINEAALTSQARALLTDEVVALLAKAHRRFEHERQTLLAARRTRQDAYDDGVVPGFLPEEEHPEAHTDWQVNPLPEDLLQRRVEITGPVNDPKMVINMLSRTDDGHRADAAMLDFEDAMKPTWPNVMQGVQNVKEAAEGTLSFTKTDADGNAVKEYAIDPDDMPLLMVRVRGLHLYESNLLVNNIPVSGGLLDLVLTAYHTAQTLIDQGKTPKYYIPKVEHYEEARWWNTVLSFVEKELGIDDGTIKTTLLIETLEAAFQMEEILYEMRTHAAGLNGGRWDKIFSDIKVLKAHDDRIMADRNSIGMNRSWMSNYVKQLIRVCHKHGAFGMGGMAPQTPGRTEAMRKQQVEKVVADKEFEASIGHDGCWVSHPYFIGPAMKPFDEKLNEKGATNQLDVIPDLPDQPDLLPKSTSPKTLDGVRVNVRVAIGYMQGWGNDYGCVAWDNRMEDLATFEISRAQVWQWLHHEVTLDDGTDVTPALVTRIFDEEIAVIESEVEDAMEGASDEAIEEMCASFRVARACAEDIFLEDQFRAFLTCASERFGDEAHKEALLREDSCV